MSIQQHINILKQHLTAMYEALNENSYTDPDAEILPMQASNGIWITHTNRNGLVLGIAAHKNRIATLEKIQRGEVITEQEHQQLLKLKPLAEDPAIKNYLAEERNNDQVSNFTLTK